MQSLDRRGFNRALLAGIAGAAVPLNLFAQGARTEIPVTGSDASHLPAASPAGRRHVPLSVRGGKAMIASSHGGRPMEDAVELLRQGGNAADAALSMAIAQVVHSAGRWVSFAGIMTLVYYDAKSRGISSMNAGFNTVGEELDPLSIPRAKSIDPSVKTDSTSGRTMLVPGFFAGLEAAHRKFGAAPFARLFESGIRLAEDGMVLDADFANHLETDKQKYSRLPETRDIFIKPDGTTCRAGETFRQLALAKTLRNIAKAGKDYVYDGPWGRKFVKAVQADGGKLSLKDLARYQVDWGTPIHTSYKGFDVYSLHQAHFMHGMLRLAAEGDLAAMGRYYESADSFYWYHKIFRATGTNMAIMGKRINQLAVPASDWLDDAKVKLHWAQIRAGRFPRTAMSNHPQHSDGIVVVDTQGNIASLLHSTNATLMPGLYVDGISIPGPAAAQQYNIKNAGPGNKLPNFVPNTIVLKDGKPVIATVAIGVALHQETVKVLTNIIDYGKAGREAVDAPSFLEPKFDEEGPAQAEAVMAGEYPTEVLEAVRAKGMAVDEFTPRPPRTEGDSSPAVADTGRPPGIGIVPAIVIDPRTGTLEGVSAKTLGSAQGF